MKQTISTKDKIREKTNSSGGFVTSQWCKENGIANMVLTRMVEDGELRRLAKGVYVDDKQLYDFLYLFQMRFKKAVFSYDTALHFLNQTENFPYRFDVSVPQGYKFNNSDHSYIIHYENKKYADLGVIEAKTAFGNTIRVHSFERVLCDFFANEHKVDPESFAKTVHNYLRYKNKDWKMLNLIAKKMNISEDLFRVLEIVNNG